MTTKTTRVLHEEKVSDGNRPGEELFLVARVTYNKAGQRGYWLQVDVEGRGVSKTGTPYTSFMLGGPSACVFREAAARFSAKRLAEIVIPSEMLAEARQKVLDGIVEHAKKAEERRASIEKAEETAGKGLL